MTNGYTMVPNWFWDIAPKLSQAERDILLFIIRKTDGYRKKKDHISITQFMDNLNLARATVVKAVADLKAKGLISYALSRPEKGGHKINQYEIHTSPVDELVQSASEISSPNEPIEAKTGSKNEPTTDRFKESNTTTHSVYEPDPKFLKFLSIVSNKIGMIVNPTQPLERHFRPILEHETTERLEITCEVHTEKKRNKQWTPTSLKGLFTPDRIAEYVAEFEQRDKPKKDRLAGHTGPVWERTPEELSAAAS